MSLSKSRDEVRTGLVEFAWSQWAQLGLSAHTTRSDRWAMDPEALVLFTAGVAHRDPRLFDELLDWLSLNGRLLSLQRLRNLVPRFPIDRRLADALVAWVAEAAPALRWPTPKSPPAVAAEGEALFSPEVVSFVGERDPVFARYGYARPLAARSGKSVEPDLRLPINLALRLRLLFGAGTRSEVLRVLLTHADGSLDAARIAEEAGFAKRNVNEALTALAASGAAKARWARNGRLFLVHRDKWANVLEIGPSASYLPTFVSWVHLLPSLVEVLVWLEGAADSADSDYMPSTRARDLVDRITPDLEALGLEAPHHSAHQGAAFLTAFENLSASLLSMIADEA